MKQTSDPETRIQRSIQAQRRSIEQKRQKQTIRQLCFLPLPIGFELWDVLDQDLWLEENNYI